MIEYMDHLNVTIGQHHAYLMGYVVHVVPIDIDYNSIIYFTSIHQKHQQIAWYLGRDQTVYIFQFLENLNTLNMQAKILDSNDSFTF